VSYASAFLTVCAASGNFPRRSYSEAIGWKRMEKCWARLLPDVKSAGEDVRDACLKEETGRHMLFTESVNVLVSFRNLSAAVSRRVKFR
jgi:hypothetical protein